MGVDAREEIESWERWFTFKQKARNVAGNVAVILMGSIIPIGFATLYIYGRIHPYKEPTSIEKFAERIRGNTWGNMVLPEILTLSEKGNICTVTNCKTNVTSVGKWRTDGHDIHIEVNGKAGKVWGDFQFAKIGANNTLCPVDASKAMMSDCWQFDATSGN